MHTRRDCIVGLSALAATGATARADLNYQVLKVGPRPRLIRGKPDKVDFGHGLLIPMSRDAFHTLWEGDDRWITYGHGFGRRAAAAMSQAEEAAIGTMKLYLLTLAFAPGRLMRVDGGGWRLKSENTANLVKGEIALPGRPVMPTTDAWAPIGGNRGGSNGVSSAATSGGIATLTSSGDPAGGVDYSSPSGEEAAHATTGWLIWKKEVTLDVVRHNAVLIAG